MFRLYEVPECPFCQKAKEFLRDKEVPVEHMARLNDPVIQAGFAVIFPGTPPKFPILVDLNNNTTQIGFVVENYERMVQTYRANLSASLSNGNPTPQQPPSEAQDVSQEPPPEAQGTAGVPDVLGIMDGLSVDARPNGGA